MKTFHQNHDPPLDNAGILVQAYHAAGLLSAAHTHTHTVILISLQMVTCIAAVNKYVCEVNLVNSFSNYKQLLLAVKC